MTAPTIVDWHARFGFGRPRPVNLIQAVFIHTTENSAATSAENVAQYQLNTRSGSYHYIADRTKLVLCNTDDWLTWSVGNRGNDVGLHISIVGRAAWSRDQWLSEEQAHGTLSRVAWQIARWCKAYNLPVAYVPGLALRRGDKGISTHDAARIAWGVTDHTDPGPGFPMDVMLTLVEDHINPPTEKDDMTFTADDRAKLDRVHHELTHQFGSRVDPDAPNPYRDTSIGYILEIDKKIERGDVEHLAARLDRIEAAIEHIEDATTRIEDALDRLAGGTA